MTSTSDSTFPRTRHGTGALRVVMQSWAQTSELHSWTTGANKDTLDLVERRLGVKLPTDLRALYAASQRWSLLDGNLQMNDLYVPDGSEFDLATGTSDLRDCGWPIPAELVVFGGEGADCLFGIWLTGKRTDRRPIIEVAPIFEPACMAVVGTELTRFLTVWTAFHLILRDAEENAVALETLGVPRELRDPGAKDLLPSLRLWGDPDLPDPDADAFEAPLDPDALRTCYGARRRDRRRDPLTVDDL